MSENEQLTEEQMDALVNETNTPSNNDIPMHAPEPEPQAPAQTDQDYIEFPHNGKTIKATREEAKKWAMMGYDYPQKMGEFNKQRQEFERQRQEFESQYAPYRQLDEWAKQNPTQWQTFSQQWEAYNQGLQNPIQQQGQTDPYQPKFQIYDQQLNQISQGLSTLLAERERAERESADKRYQDEVKSIREQYKDLDFDTPDEQGKSLEYKILEHAKNTGISNFRAAFRDFYHDQLISNVEAKAKQSLSQSVQKNSKLGVLGTSPTPKKGLQSAGDVRNKSYDVLAQEALDELLSGT